VAIQISLLANDTDFMEKSITSIQPARAELPNPGQYPLDLAIQAEHNSAMLKCFPYWAD
jgi:hypothetical protein